MTSSHRRHNPLTDEWVLVSPGRTRRPWLGQTEVLPPEERPRYDPDCYLCPRNERLSGDRNPNYGETLVFTNDFAALRPDGEPHSKSDGLLRTEDEQGTCRVICYSPRHDRRMSQMDPREIETVIDLWKDQTGELGEQYRWVQVFENNGEAMGASNPHPHGQIWAGTALPTLPSREDAMQRTYTSKNGSLLLLDYIDQESGGARIVVENDDWVALVPYWATWPFETLVVPTSPTPRITDIEDRSRRSLALVMSDLLTRYDNLFTHPFPYSMGWHGAPFGSEGSHWQLHAHFYPPLLRSATVRKFMVGYELLAEAQRDFTPEEAAERLRAVSGTRSVSGGTR